VRNLLEEFKMYHGVRAPTILGVREHIFTGRYIFAIISELVVMWVVLERNLTWNSSYLCLLQCFIISVVHVYARN
jgi:hypothetical protein